MGIVIFNGQSSLDHRIQVETPPNYKTPQRDYESIHIPGRNGDLMLSRRHAYRNVERTYEVAAYDRNDNFIHLASELSRWVHSASTYAKLEDSYEPDYYRLAVYMEALEIENIFQKAGRCKLTFDCKPQRFLKNGTKKRRITNSRAVINNPTKQPSEPLITIYGSGNVTVQIGVYPIVIKDLNGFITIDSELQDCYQGTLNRNQNVTLSVGFPLLHHGKNTVSWTSSGVTAVEVIPRWWEV